MRPLFIFLAVFVQLPRSFGQKVVATSTCTLENAPAAWKLADSLNSDGYKLRNAEPTKSYNCLRKALQISRETNYNSGAATALKNIGFYHRYRWELKAAYDASSAALLYFKSHRDTVEQLACLYNLSVVLNYMGEKYAALDTALRSIQLAERIADTAEGYKWQILHTLQVGNIYASVKETDTAKRYLSKAWMIAKTHHLPDTFRCYQGLGEVAEQEKNWQAALYYYRRGLTYAQKNKPPHTLLLIANLLDIADVYCNSGDYGSAVATTDSVKRLIATKPDFAGYGSWADHVLTKAEVGRRNYVAAKSWALRCLHATVNMGPLSYKDESKYWLASIYAAQHRYDSAYDFLTRYKIYQDSVNNENVTKRWATATLQNENRLKTEAIRFRDKSLILEKKVNRRSLLIFFIFILLLGVSVVLVLSLIRNSKRIRSLLHNILPVQIVKEFRKRSKIQPKEYNEVSILFTDFYHFTDISAGMEKDDVVNTLNDYFTAFDDIVTANNLEKIRTIGDAYMAAGGLPEPNTTNPIDAVRAALAIRDFVRDYNAKRMAENRACFEIRIGVNTGPVLAGVIGKRKYAYDIWGAAVNIASRMESNGPIGEVNISRETRELVKDKFNCVSRGEIYAKNVGDMEMYTVDRASQSVTDA